MVGGKNAKDNFPLKSTISIRPESVPTQTGQKESEGTKSTPGFTIFVFIISLIAIGISRMKK